ncbi:hypothetical protein COU60_04690 [Candidatus Pacearchaeota archaeon CG10_big_fil_rev_8_21_14_0_10_34_76]|nr:MAG: hypothetical protein COU60_04690 [Candidatus Pacearchaeota archaeon CG10_big_fil_rev_8_21_14_0_10_34_76]
MVDIWGNNNLLGLQKQKSKRGTLYSFDKDKILQRQKGLCAGKDCKKEHNGKRVPINIRSNFDHVKPLALGGKDILSNLQALCPNCHQFKTREDRKMISLRKKKSSSNNINLHSPVNLDVFKSL